MANVMQKRATKDQESLNEALDDDSASYRNFDGRARLIIIFGVGFMLGIIAMVSLFTKEFDSTNSLSPTMLTQVDPQPIYVSLAPNVTVLRTHVQHTDLVKDPKLSPTRRPTRAPKTKPLISRNATKPSSKSKGSTPNTTPIKKAPANRSSNTTSKTPVAPKSTNAASENAVAPAKAAPVKPEAAKN